MGKMSLASNTFNLRTIVAALLGLATLMAIGVAASDNSSVSSSSSSSPLRRRNQEFGDDESTSIGAGMDGRVDPDVHFGSECVKNCQITKCIDHCQASCNARAKTVADTKWFYCDKYTNDMPPPLRKSEAMCLPGSPCGECEGDCNSDEDCAGHLKCKERGGYEEVPGCLGSSAAVAQDYCYDPEREEREDPCANRMGQDVPKNCFDFSNCVYNSFLAHKGEGYKMSKKIADEGWYACDAGSVLASGFGSGSSAPPGYGGTTGGSYSGSSRYANGSCNYVLSGLSYAIEKKPICNKFWECIKSYEMNNPLSTVHAIAKQRRDSARADCNALGDNNDRSNAIFGKYSLGTCDAALGGYEKTCDDYFFCHLNPREVECDMCAHFPDNSGCETTKTCTEHCQADHLYGQQCYAECNYSDEASLELIEPLAYANTYVEGSVAPPASF